jgi:hypothetical protein
LTPTASFSQSPSELSIHPNGWSVTSLDNLKMDFWLLICAQVTKYYIRSHLREVCYTNFNQKNPQIPPIDREGSNPVVPFPREHFILGFWCTNQNWTPYCQKDQWSVQVVFPTVHLVQDRFCNILWSWPTRYFENNIQILRFRSGTEYIGRYLPFFSPDWLRI